MLPQIDLYNATMTKAGEPLQQYQQLFEQVGKTFDRTRETEDSLAVLASNIKVPETANPIKDALVGGLRESLKGIGEEAAKTGRYDIKSMKVRDIATQFLTNPTLKHLQEQYAAMKPDLDIANSKDKFNYYGVEKVNQFNPMNPDGSYNTYNSPIEKKMDYIPSVDRVIKPIQPIVENLIKSLTPEQQAKLNANPTDFVNFIQKESLTNKELAAKMSDVMATAKTDEALNQYMRYNGGEKGLQDLITSRFNTGTYSIEKEDIKNVAGLSPSTTGKALDEGITEDSLQNAPFGNINNPLGEENLKEFSTSPTFYTVKGTSSGLDGVASPDGVPYVETDATKKEQIRKTKDSQFLENIRSLDPKLKGKPLHEIADLYNKNKEIYSEQYKKSFGSTNTLKQFGDKVVPDSGFDKIAQGLALNSRGVLLEGHSPKDKGKTLADQLDAAGIEVADLEGANKKIVGVNIDSNSDDNTYNGGIVTQVTTKDGKHSFRVVHYNETYKNMFQGFVDVKKDLIRLGNTQTQKEQLEKGAVLVSKEWKPIAGGQAAKAVKSLNPDGTFSTKIRLKVYDKETKSYDETEFDDINMFDSYYTNMLINDKHFKSNFK